MNQKDFKKRARRLAARQREWDNMKDKEGTKRPGSMKK